MAVDDFLNRAAMLVPHSRPWIVDDDSTAVELALRTGMIARGHLTEKFEESVAAYVNSRHAIARSSGTAALVLALKAMQVGVGDSVILPTYVCRSVIQAVRSVGATPKLSDVDSAGVLEPSAVGKLIDERIKAIIAVHIFGQPCPISALRVYGVPIIEDACQSFGLLVDGRQAGTLGDIGVFSFHATKCFTTGEGGMLVTSRPEYAAEASRYLEGEATRGGCQDAPLSDLQAALGLSQLRRYGEFISRRTELARKFASAAHMLGLETISTAKCEWPFRFTLRVDQPFDTLKDKFLSHGVIVRRGVDELLHRTVGLDDKMFPNASQLFKTTLSIPFYPSLSDQESDRVIAALEVLGKCR